MTHKAKVLRLLSDGKPHTHHELYRLGCIAHSRVADLRRDGHDIVAWREGDNYLYQLRSLNGVASAPASPAATAPLSEIGSVPLTAGHDGVRAAAADVEPGPVPLTLFSEEQAA